MATWLNGHGQRGSFFRAKSKQHVVITGLLTGKCESHQLLVSKHLQAVHAKGWQMLRLLKSGWWFHRVTCPWRSAHHGSSIRWHEFAVPPAATSCTGGTILYHFQQGFLSPKQSISCHPFCFVLYNNTCNRNKLRLQKNRDSGRVTIYSGWWLVYPSEKYEFVNWDDEIPNIWENKIHVPNHQPVLLAPLLSFVDILIYISPLDHLQQHLSRSGLGSHCLWHRPQVGEAAARGHLQSWEIWRVPSMGVPKNGWFIMEIPMTTRMRTGGTPISGKHDIVLSCYVNCRKCCSMLLSIDTSVHQNIVGLLWNMWNGMKWMTKWLTKKEATS